MNSRERLLVSLALLSFGTLLLIPTWLVLPPDDEGLWKEISPTVFQSRELFSGHYPFWNPWVGFGVPQPLSQSLIFHPFIVFIQLLPLGAAIGAFYQLQIWIGLFAVWAVARRLSVGRWLSAVCVVTYALSSPTINYLTNFWPNVLVEWTLAPLLLLFLLKLFDADDRLSRATFAVASGLCAALMLLDGHGGVLPDYAIGFLAFLVGSLPRVRKLWPWLLVSVAVFALAGTSKVYDIWLETSRSVAARGQDVLPMDWGRLFLYPFIREHERAIALGGPFVVLGLVGFFYRGVTGRYVNGLRVGAAISFALRFVPVDVLTIRSANYFAADPFILFTIFLAALTAQTLWRRFPYIRVGLAAVALLQVYVLVDGFSPFYRAQLDRVAEYNRGQPVSLKDSLKNQPIYKFIEGQPAIRDTRIYIRSGKLFGESSPDQPQAYKFAGWWLHDLRLANGLFKGIELNEFAPADSKLQGHITDERLVRSALALDVFNIGYVVARWNRAVAPSLERMKTFTDARRGLPSKHSVVAYRNRHAWPDAVVLEPKAKALQRLPRRAGCPESGLLCANFTAVKALRMAHEVRGERWKDVNLVVDLVPRSERRVLMVSQLYRPGWRAQLSNGHTVRGYRLLGGLTGFDLPPGTSSATVSFHPTDRIVLTAVTWVTVLLGLLFVVTAPLARRSAVRRSVYAARARQAT